jgi:hypothetical protein
MAPDRILIIALEVDKPALARKPPYPGIILIRETSSAVSQTKGRRLGKIREQATASRGTRKPETGSN